MANDTRRHVVLVGRSTLWRARALDHLRTLGISVETRDDINEAIAAVKADASIACVVLAEELPHEPWIAGLARMALARPALRFIVLGSEYNLDAMIDYIRLGRRDNGPPLVQYHLNDYDYDKLGRLILGECAAMAGAR